MTGVDDQIAKLCLDHFDSFSHIKRGRPKEGKQWTVLASFVQEQEKKIKVVAFGTGTSCLGFDQTCCRGRLVHDSHAEVIARRSFSRYLYNQLLLASKSDEDTIFVLDVKSGTYKLKDGVCFHFYSSQPPCGDASIYAVENMKHDYLTKEKSNKDLKNRMDGNRDKLTPASKRQKTNSEEINDFIQADDINRTGAKCAPGEKQDSYGTGTAYHEVGLLRTKPGRGIPTHSMSCSDKMMKWNIMGCQGSLIMTFLSEPIYLSSFVTVDDGASIPSLKRALIERIPAAKNIGILKGTPYRLNRPVISGTNLRLKFSKSIIRSGVPCGSSISWCDVNDGSYDVISKNGLRLGVTKKHQSSPKAESGICRLQLFKLFKSVYAVCNNSLDATKSDKYRTCKTYHDFKKSILYYDVWKNVQRSLFPHWVAHDKALDCFT